MERKMVDFIKEQYPPGTRIRLNSMDDPYAPILPGTEGEVDFVDDAGQLHMKWDNGRSLALIPGEDSFTVLPPKLTTLKLYMPLTADLYERNEYGEFDDSSTLLEGRELRGYQDQITAALVKNRMPEEAERGIMHWYHKPDSINAKVYRSPPCSVHACSFLKGKSADIQKRTRRADFMKIAIGMIVRDILSAHPLTDFLDNAEEHGHALDRVIIVYSHQADPGAVEELRSRTNLSLIKLQSNERAHLIMKEIGVRHSSIHQLLYCPLIDAHGLIPYGFNRNQALMEAMFTGTDYLLFVDSDVRPEVLRKTPDGAVQSEEIDFIGAHLHGLSLGADVTSSDYSGYNILPPASFDGMKDLLWGLHKESMADFWQNSEAHRGLVIQEDQNAEPQPTTKVLGGNLGIRMSALTTLPPFFSPYYFYNRTPLLARGEDTLMGMAASQSHIRCLDIQTPIFHDTYGDYPKVPDLRNDSRVRDRLYYACTGWVGRNVFFRWKTGHTPSEFTQRNRQLAAGAKALARYTNDRRFLYLPDIQSAAESWLPDMIGQYQKSKEAWNELTERWFGR